MKILAIRIKNLASIEEADIDFTVEPLKSAGLYAITGPMGAGKSTILDALCLALYAKTPRFDKAFESGNTLIDISGHDIKQNDVKSILREGAGEGYAEVDFIGTDDSRYRARWHVYRANRKATGKLQQDNLLLTNLDNGQNISGYKKDLLETVEKLVGLNFDQFTRSVLLAQGEFTAFLKSNNEQKSDLLEKLTGTQIYSEISLKVHQRLSEENVSLTLLKKQIGHIQIIEPKDIALLNTEQQLIETKIIEIENKLISIAKELEWNKQLQIFEISYKDAVSQLEIAERLKAETLPRQFRIKNVEKIQEIRQWFNTIKNSENKLAKAQTEQKSLIDKYTLLNSEQELVQTQLKAVNSNLEKLESDKIAAEPLFLEAAKLDTILREKRQQLEDAIQQLQTTSDNYDKEKELLSDLDKEIKSHKERIIALNNWLSDNKSRIKIAKNKDIIIHQLNQASEVTVELENVEVKIKDNDKKIEYSK